MKPFIVYPCSVCQLSNLQSYCSNDGVRQCDNSILHPFKSGGIGDTSHVQPADKDTVIRQLISIQVCCSVIASTFVLPRISRLIRSSRQIKAASLCLSNSLTRLKPDQIELCTAAVGGQDRA